MKATKLVIGASLLIAIAAVPGASAAETYEDRIGECTPGLVPDAVCIVGNPTESPEEQECSVFDSVRQTVPLTQEGDNNDVVGCLGQ